MFCFPFIILLFNTGWRTHVERIVSEAISTDSCMFSNAIVASWTGPALSNFQSNIHGFFDLTFKVLSCPSLPSFITPRLIQSTKPTQKLLLLLLKKMEYKILKTVWKDSLLIIWIVLALGEYCAKQTWMWGWSNLFWKVWQLSHTGLYLLLMEIVSQAQCFLKGKELTQDIIIEYMVTPPLPSHSVALFYKYQATQP